MSKVYLITYDCYEATPILGTYTSLGPAVRAAEICANRDNENMYVVELPTNSLYSCDELDNVVYTALPDSYFERPNAASLTMMLDGTIARGYLEYHSPTPPAYVKFRRAGDRLVVYGPLGKSGSIESQLLSAGKKYLEPWKQDWE